MEFKEYLFVLLIVLVTAVFTGYFTYRILDKKISILYSQIENFKNTVSQPDTSNQCFIKNNIPDTYNHQEPHSI